MRRDATPPLRPVAPPEVSTAHLWREPTPNEPERPLLVGDFDDHFDLDRRIFWKNRDPHSRSGMAPRGTEDFAEQVTRTVDDRGLPRERGVACDESHYFDDGSNVVHPTDNRRHRGERVQNAYPGALLSRYFVYISSDLPRDDELTANEGQLT